MHGVIPIVEGESKGLQQNSVRWGNKLKQAVAVCNGLTMINKLRIAGDDVEQTLFKMVEARFVVSFCPL